MRLQYWLPTLIWMGLIFYLSSRTGNELGSMFPFLDSFNWGHFVAYFILALFVYYGLSKTSKPKRIYLLSIIICLLYGASDEFHQAFVPNRTPDFLDLLNDTIGASLAMLMVRFTGGKCRKMPE